MRVRESSLDETEILRSVTVRRGQDFFRNAVLAAYRGRCCITGLPARDLLRASHIIPWRTDVKSRLDPTNGLCLNALYDVAFDVGLLTVDEGLKVVFSRGLRDDVGIAAWVEGLAP